MYKETIGIVGGFGGFATAGFFQKLLNEFNTGYERDYPRIIMDNDFRMPSRTRALLYDENIDEIASMISTSVKNLIRCGADYIVLVCGTAHWFLDKVYEIVPESKGKILDIVDLCGEKLFKLNVSNCFVVAAEGTLKVKLYDTRFSKFDISVSSPNQKCFERIRYFIESVKQNSLTYDTKVEFLDFLDGFLENCKEKYVVLGCTEFSVLALKSLKIF